MSERSEHDLEMDKHPDKGYPVWMYDDIAGKAKTMLNADLARAYNEIQKHLDVWQGRAHLILDELRRRDGNHE